MAEHHMAVNAKLRYFMSAINSLYLQGSETPDIKLDSGQLQFMKIKKMRSI